MKTAPGSIGIILIVAIITIICTLLFPAKMLSIAITGVIVGLLAAGWYGNMYWHVDPEREESAEIFNALMQSKYYASIHEIVAEERYPGTTEGIFKWRAGWNYERLEREYDDLVKQVRENWRNQ